MKKRVTVSDILLLTISGILDFFQEIKDPANLISHYYYNFYGFVPQKWQKIYLKKVLAYNIKTKKVFQKENFLNLTKVGEDYLKNKFPLFWNNKKRSSDLWLVVFDVEEITRYQRDYLRKTLKLLNFKMLQKSVWITSNKISCDRIFYYIKKWQLEEKVLIIKANFLSEKIKKFIVGKCWSLEEINQDYREIFLKLKKLFDKLRRNKDFKKLNEEFFKLRKEAFEIIIKDPFLAPKLLPKPWYYQKVLKISKMIWSIIKRKIKK